MSEDSKVVRLRQPEEIENALTSILRTGARRLLEQAIEAEVETFLVSLKDVTLPDGRDRVVRHGHGPERTIQTGIGPVKVRWAKCATAAAKMSGSGSTLPWRSSPSGRGAPRAWMPCCRCSTCAASPPATLGGAERPAWQGRANLSPSVIARLKQDWAGDYARWQKRDLSARRYVYIWADGVYLQPRMEPVAECMLVIIGTTPESRKELVRFQVGVCESAQSWRELLVHIQARGLTIAPELAVADGALGLWKAL